jgi:hypothetical protein
MKIKHIADTGKFLEIIDGCSGKVELYTGEGDCLNLKSKLSQYVSLAGILADKEMKDLELVAYEEADKKRLEAFLAGCE